MGDLLPVSLFPQANSRSHDAVAWENKRQRRGDDGGAAWPIELCFRCWLRLGKSKTEKR